MKTTLSILAGLAFLIWTANPKINFKPFSISFETPYEPFAIILMLIAISLFKNQSEIKGYKKGTNDLYDAIVKERQKNKEI